MSVAKAKNNATIRNNECLRDERETEVTQNPFKLSLGAGFHSAFSQLQLSSVEFWLWHIY